MKNKFLFALAFIAAAFCLIRLLPAYIFAHAFNMGVIGVELAIAIDVSVRGIICIVRLLNGKWRPKQLIK